MRVFIRPASVESFDAAPAAQEPPVAAETPEQRSAIAGSVSAPMLAQLSPFAAAGAARQQAFLSPFPARTPRSSDVEGLTDVLLAG